MSITSQQSPSPPKDRLLAKARHTADTLRYCAGLLFGNAPVAATLLIVSNITTGLATPMVVWSMTGLIGVLSTELINPWQQVTPWLAMLGGALVLRSVDGATTQYLATVIRQQVDGAMYRDVTDKAIRVPLQAFESRTYYDHLETGKRAIAGHLVYVLSSLAAFVAAAVGVAGLLFLYFQAHWALAVVLVATVVVTAIVEAKQERTFNQVNYRSSPLRQEIGYWAGLLANHRAAAELRVFQLGTPILSKWRNAFDRYVTDINRARYRLAIAGFLSGLVQEIVALATTVTLLVLTMANMLSIGSMVALLYGVGRFRELVGSFSWTVADLVDHWSELQHVRAFLQLPTVATGAGKQSPPRPLKQGVTFHNVSFVYPGAERPALIDVTFTLQPGERVALVGENGAGKSTLVRLLLGLYEPTAGRITVDGVDLNDIDPEQWRREASVVFQDFMRYAATVEENIAYGASELLYKNKSAAAQPRVVEAARKSDADGFIRRLPHAYDTLLGKQFAGGTELSTGQWQRVALARAYVRDAQIIVLDEPTAALDPKAEVEVYRQFQQAADGMSAVFISHRLGSARLADRILVLADGQLLESGSHEALLQSDGEYARLYRLQAGWYTDEEEVATG